MTCVSILIFAPCAFITWYRGPGFVKRETSVSQTELLSRFPVHELCFECEIVTLPRSYHCNVCQRCVERYDHHCPWINSCVGTRNHSWFFIFVSFQAIYVLVVLTQIIAFYVTYFKSNDEYSGSGPIVIDAAMHNTCLDPNITPHFADWCHSGISAYSDILVVFFVTLLLALAAPFTMGLLTLWIVQLRNFCAGMTTMERMGSASHRNRSFSFVETIMEVADENTRVNNVALDSDYYTGTSYNALLSTPMRVTDSY